MRMTWTKGGVIVAVVVISALTAGVLSGAMPLDAALNAGRWLLVPGG